jgi:LacI family transcriptional regulator
VSPMTVSRVMNRESNVRVQARQLVETAIRELNYSPSPAARSLAGSAPHRVGVLYDNPSTGFAHQTDANARSDSDDAAEFHVRGVKSRHALLIGCQLFYQRGI